MFLCSRTLEALRLDRNALEGEVPLTLNRLTSLSEPYLSYNKLSGALPDLSGKSSLTYVDLSNNSFQESDPMPWYSTLTSLSTLVMEFGTLKWKLPQTLFDLNDMLNDNGGGIQVGGIIGIAICCTLLIIVLIVVVVYAIQQKKRAEKAIGLSKPFGSWAPSTKDIGGAPQLKGARWISGDVHLYGVFGEAILMRISNEAFLMRVYSDGFMVTGDALRMRRFDDGSRCWVFENLTAKVADFGLSKLVSDSEKGHVSTQVKGTLDISIQNSTGVTTTTDKRKYIVREVRLAMDMTDVEEYGLREILDPNLKDSLLTGFGRFIQLAMQCVEESAAERPTMSDVVKILENILKSDGNHTSSTSNSSSANEFANVFGSTRGAANLYIH
ncbi:probable leucine-rich repeat receptor-like protein kinase [Tanacetum coccineum]